MMLKMLNVVAGLLLLLSGIYAQDAEPEILLMPENWKFERIDFPLGFAPDIDFEGFEELRFSPGIFTTTSPDYFTYIFTMMIKNKRELTSSELESMLLSYYRGLGAAVAEQKEALTDTTKITVAVRAKSGGDKSGNRRFSASVHFIDYFTDGREIDLHMEIELLSHTATNDLVLFALVSPQQPDSSFWKELRMQKQLILENNAQLK